MMNLTKASGILCALFVLLGARARVCPHPPAYPMRTPSLILPVASPCHVLAMPFLFVGHGIECMMVAAMTMIFAVMLSYCVCSWVCACGWFVPSWFLSFSVFVCMFVCESGGGGLLGSMRG